ncbi:hypothetical protein J437_LFUL019239 [Ladona fulva]|uniref:PDZ domain-containing protein n=1 Tax=Ladona fulva TaxID=123851 RepID=A0A8K0P6Y0_LADFU|nr:hypothetical protein J437_LFUL019239 [Ladona fulva]
MGKWTSWSPIGALVGTGGTNSKNNDKRRAFDDSFMGEPERVSVALRGHDFTGLGFNVCGNMRDGIFVRDVLHRGPASESGQIAAGDRIVSLGISFEHMVFEDALTILSYASPYEVLLQVEKGASPPGSTLLAGSDISSGQTSLKRTTASTVPSNLGSGQSPDKQRPVICHPFYRSQSIDDLDKIGKASMNAKRTQQIAEMTRSKSRLQEDGSKGGPATEVEGRGMKVEEEKIQKREASPPKEDEARTEGHQSTFPKFGVRVLPPSAGNPSASEKSKSHNPGGHHNNPGGDGRQETTITIATPEPQKQNERNSMIEMGVSKEEPNPSEENPKMQEEETRVEIETPEVENPSEMDRSKESSEEKMIGEVPEEVRMAAMAAVTNRKSMGFAHTAKPEDEVMEPKRRRQRSASGSSSESDDEDKANGGKRRAPAPPKSLGSPEDGNMIRCDTPPPEQEEQGEEKKKKGGTRIELGMDDITVHHQPTEVHIDFESEPVTPGPDSRNSQTSESTVTALEESDMEVEDTPEKAKRTATGGKAASLGDLSRLEGGEVLRPPRMRAGPSFAAGGSEGGVVLERAVSLDLGNAEEVVVGTPPVAVTGSAKKRKAPAPPTPASRGDAADETDGGLRVNAKSESGEYGKEPRLAGATDTFGRRLKKSSDWGTMEEALLAGGSPSSSSTSSSTSAGRTILHLNSAPSFQLSSTAISPSDVFSSEHTPSEVSTTKVEGEESMESSPAKGTISEVSLQSSVITSSDADVDSNPTISSTTEMVHKIEAPSNSTAGLDTNRVIVTTSTNLEDSVVSTTYPGQQSSRARGDVVHVEVTDDLSSNYPGDAAKVTSGDSFQSSFQRAREFFEENSSAAAAADDDDDDDVTSSPPSLPTSPIPTMQPSGSPLSLHSTTTYISSIEDIPVVPASLIDRGELGVHHHITEIQVRSIGEDGNPVETREFVMGQSNPQTFLRMGDMRDEDGDRISTGSGEVKLSISPVKIPMNDIDIPINTYVSDSFADNARTVIQSGAANVSEALLQGRDMGNKMDNRNVESSTFMSASLGSPGRPMEVSGGISSTETMGDLGNSTVQIRMREGPSGWVPQRQRSSSRMEESGEEVSEGHRNEGVKPAKKKPPVPPRKDTSGVTRADSPTKSDAHTSSTFTPNAKTIVELPMSFNKRLVQVHDAREEDEEDGIRSHRVSEREVIQITPQELDKVMMSHSQFLSHARGDSPSKSEQWLSGGPSTRTVVHRIVEHWVSDEDGKIVTETTTETTVSPVEVMSSEAGTVTPPNGIVSTAAESEGTNDARRQNMSVTRIMVDPEFSGGLGSEGVAKAMMVANLQLTGMEGKTSAPTAGLHT